MFKAILVVVTILQGFSIGHLIDDLDLVIHTLR